MGDKQDQRESQHAPNCGGDGSAGDPGQQCADKRGLRRITQPRQVCLGRHDVKNRFGTAKGGVNVLSKVRL
jgi:hypothetical protein